MVNEPGHQVGSLERLGIDLETQPPEHILTPGEAKGARFQISQPKGYYPADVDTFMETSVIPSLTWYANALHERDLSVHKLGEKLDQAEVDLKNLKTELAAAQYSAPLGAALEKNQDDKEMTAILSQLEQTRLELAAAAAALAVAQTEAVQFKEYSEQQDEYITALLDQIEGNSDVSESETASSEEESMTDAAEGDFAVEEVASDVVEGEYVFEEPSQPTASEPVPNFEATEYEEPQIQTPPTSVFDTRPEAFPSARPFVPEPEEGPKPSLYEDLYDSSAFLVDEETVAVEEAPKNTDSDVESYDEEPLAIILPDEPEEYADDDEDDDVLAALSTPNPPRINSAESEPRVQFPSVPRRTPIPDELPQGIRPDDLE